MNRRETSLIILYWIGVVAILGGQFLYGYANTTISRLQDQLSTLSTIQNEYYAVQGSLNWWQTQTLTVYGPLSVMLEWAGIATVIFVIVFGTWTILQERKTRKIQV